jgi:flavin reductase (DIM6/NTAB) family NADH-FMN oxidoreductase RutF
MIAVAVEHDADLNETIDYSEHFTLQLLGEDNEEMITAFGTKSEVDDDQINGYPFKKIGGQAILQNTVGYVICEVKETVNAGDHRLYIGEVIDHKHDNNRAVVHTDSVAMQYAD